LGLKDKACLYRTCFCQAVAKKPSPPLFSVTGCGKRGQDVLPALLFAIYHTSGLLSLPKNEIRAGKLLVDPGHLQEEFVGGRPHIVTEELAAAVLGLIERCKKHTYLLMTKPKNYVKQVSLLNGTVSKLCCPAHLFPNIPRTP